MISINKQSVKPLDTQYTDVIVTCGSPGQGVVATVCFTHNPALNFGRIGQLQERQIQTHRRQTHLIARAEERAARLLDLLAQYGIDPRWIQYRPVPEDSSTTYCAEKRQHYIDTVNVHRDLFPDDAFIVVDAGNEFKYSAAEGRGSIFPDLNIKNVATLPPDVHHALNPCDAHWHGGAKNRWRAASRHMDDVESTLCLMHELRKATQHDMERWFKADLAFEVNRRDDAALMSACEKIVAGTKSRWEGLHAECLEEYYDEYPDDEPDGVALLTAQPGKFVGSVRKY